MIFPDTQVTRLLTIRPDEIDGVYVTEDGVDIGQISRGEANGVHGWQWIKDGERSQVFPTKIDAFEAFALTFYNVAN
jgi:hypothetical protein